MAAIQNLKSSKAPGRYGLPAEFYKRFKDLLVEPLTDLGTSLYSDGTMPNSWAKTRIIVIPKKDRDPAKVESYRPISLINHDAKIFTSIMAKRLNSFIGAYVHVDQLGFIPSRQISDNIRKTLDVIHHCVSHQIPSLVVALDAEKAFDKLESSYLQLLLKRMNFGPHFLMAINTHPVAQICVNHFRSDDFSLSRGTRQGCLLSPILFAISLEPLAAAIRNDPGVRGIDINSHTYKLNLFADDTVVCLRDPEFSLPHLISAIDAFGAISGFTINYSKSELYPIALSDTLKHRMQLRTPFRWVRTSWRHLGVHNPLDFTTLFSVNYTPLIAKIRTMLSNWESNFFSWIERVEMVKSFILLQFLFLFQTLLLDLRPRTLKTWQSMLNSFVWGAKHPRIGFVHLNKPKSLGGFGFPDLKFYYVAAQLRPSLLKSDQYHGWLQI